MIIGSAITHLLFGSGRGSSINRGSDQTVDGGWLHPHIVAGKRSPFSFPQRLEHHERMFRYEPRAAGTSHWTGRVDIANRFRTWWSSMASCCYTRRDLQLACSEVERSLAGIKRRRRRWQKYFQIHVRALDKVVSFEDEHLSRTMLQRRKSRGVRLIAGPARRTWEEWGMRTKDGQEHTSRVETLSISKP